MLSDPFQVSFKEGMPSRGFYAEKADWADKTQSQFEKSFYSTFSKNKNSLMDQSFYKLSEKSTSNVSTKKKLHVKQVNALLGKKSTFGKFRVSHIELTPQEASHMSKTSYEFNKIRNGDPHLKILQGPTNIFVDKRCLLTEASAGADLKIKVKAN